MTKLNSTFISLILFLSIIIVNTAQASIIYTFTPVSGSTTATIEFASPPATSSSAWNTTFTTDIISLAITMNSGFSSPALGGGSFVLGSSGLVSASNNGTELDNGAFQYFFPSISDAPLWNISFSDQLDLDQISVSYFGPIGSTGETVFGNWTVSNSPVPVPAAIWLFGSGLSGLLVIGRRKNKI